MIELRMPSFGADMEDAVFVQTSRPDVFYARITEMAAHDGSGDIYEITSPDDNLQAVFEYLVKS